MSRKPLVSEATYITEYTLQLRFSDGIIQTLNFKPFFNKHQHPQYDKYQDIKNFKKFFIENGNVVWGKNWDLIFPVEKLHEGKFE